MSVNYRLSITPYRPLPSRSDITYFGAGPARLPTEIIEDAAQALINYQSTDLGIAEHSHRSAIATNIISETKAIWRPTLIPRTITR
jgi:phosphoserine aminotransferase